MAKKAATQKSKKVSKKVAPKKAPKKTVKKVAKKVTPKKVTKKVAPKKVVKKVASKKVTKKAAPKKVVKKVTPKKVTKKVAPKKVTKKVEAKKTKKSVSSKNSVQKAKEKETPKVVARAGKQKKQIKMTVTPAVVIDPHAEVIERVAEEIEALSENFLLSEIFSAIRSIDYFTSKTDDCIEKSCDNPATTDGYCRLHYIANWQQIKQKESILVEGKLQDFIEELVLKYPTIYLEELLIDLQDEASFSQILKELDIDVSDDDFSDFGDLEDDDSVGFEAKPTVSED